jgi:uncharacterized coiled-coil DUF342 family protein
MENSKVISRADELKARAESAVEQAKDLSQSSINYAKEIIKLFGEAG